MTAESGSVALVVLATGRYIEFVPPMVRSAQEHVAGLARCFVLSDVRPPEIDGVDVVWLPWGHTPWPYSTLLRYRAITAYGDALQGFDRIVHIDADMLFVAPVELPAAAGVFAVRHPGYLESSPDDLPFERRSTSRACVPIGEGRVYVAGGVQGGSTAEYLSACRTMAAWLHDDVGRGVVPVWHDESMWNRYCITYPPATVLPVEFCTPDSSPVAGARILALTKDHDRFRDVAIMVRWRRGLVRWVLRTAARAKRVLRRLR